MVTLRAFEEPQIDAVLALWQGMDGVGLGLADTPHDLAMFLSRNAGLSPIALDANGDVVGAALCGHDGRRGYLYHVAVRESSRGQGIGRLLVDYCRAALERVGIGRVSIHVFANNASAIRFWAHLGWQPREDLIVVQVDLPRVVENPRSVSTRPKS
jgi:ribosomal protein S18 acetylase RimI-like enzyme